MDRIINIKVKGNHLTKDSNNAGTRGEANVTTLRITFGDDWNSYVKKILFWDAHGMNPTKYTLIPEWKENSDTNVYRFNIPPSALGIAGNMTFRIDGYIENKRQRSVSATLEVEDALIEDDIEEVTQSDLDNLLAQGENIKNIINKGVNDTFGYRNEAVSAAGNAKTSETNAGNSAKAAASAMEAAGSSASTAVSTLDAVVEERKKAEKAKEDAGTAQSKAEEAYDDFIEKRDETYNIIGNRVSQVEGYIEDVRKLKKQAEDAKDGALVYASNYENLVLAVTQAENAKTIAVDNASTSYTFKEEAETSASNAEKSASNAKTSETNAKTYEGYALAYKNLSNQAEIAAWQHKADAEKAQTAAETAERMAESQAFAASESAINAATSASNAKTYADNAENAVSQSRYIGSNGNWYVWDDSRKTFVDSGETAHAGSTVYVGSNPPSNAQVWIEPDGDSTIAMSLKEIYNTIKSMKPKAVTITLLSSAWVVDGDRYAQIVSIPEATAYSKVDLQPSAEQLTIFHEKDIAFVTENVGGTITVYCIGQKPTNDYTIQATITEVSK